MSVVVTTTHPFEVAEKDLMPTRPMGCFQILHLTMDDNPVNPHGV